VETPQREELKVDLACVERCWRLSSHASSFHAHSSFDFQHEEELPSRAFQRYAAADLRTVTDQAIKEKPP